MTEIGSWRNRFWNQRSLAMTWKMKKSAMSEQFRVCSKKVAFCPSRVVGLCNVKHIMIFSSKKVIQCHREMQRSDIVTGRQWSCGKAMLSQVSVCLSIILLRGQAICIPVKSLPMIHSTILYCITHPSPRSTSPPHMGNGDPGPDMRHGDPFSTTPPC